jgi:hypothetical protein
MKTTTSNYWWKTKAFKIGLGIFIAIALLVAVLFGDKISQLLNLFGSKASTDYSLIVDDNSAMNIPGQAYLPAGDLSDGVIYIEPADSDTGDGYITLP